LHQQPILKRRQLKLKAKLESSLSYYTSTGHNPVTETSHFCEYFVSNGFLVKNTRSRELRSSRDVGQFWAILGISGYFFCTNML
jgi:hypothetical protein